LPEDQHPKDPVSENMAFLRIEPTKAFIYQDHDAHIATHMSFIQDPMIQQMIGQNPMAQQIGSAVQAHVAEHLSFLYRRKIEERIGVPLPPPNEKLPEDVEVEISRLTAQAGAQLLQMNMAQAQQAQAQQAAQDPMVQMQQAELQIKAEEVKRKAAKDQADIALAQARLQVEQERIAVEARKEQQRIAAKSSDFDKKLKADVLTKLNNR